MQTIAVDMDDVLGNENHAVMRFMNERYGLSHTTKDYDIPGEYWGYWEQVWGVDKTEGAIRYAEFLKSKAAYEIVLEPLPGAVDVLRHLSERYRLCIVTSRSADLVRISERWLQEYFPDIFSGVHFVELWQEGTKVTKARICDDIGASYLIDDNVEHCALAQEVGVQSLLYGDYGWNRHVPVPKGVVRVRDWQAVQEFFDAKAR